jgi:hypothetical protein
MKKLTRDRVVPTISARVSCEIGGTIVPVCPAHAKLGHQEENPRQTLFAGVEKLIDKIGLGSHAPDQQEFQVHLREGMLLVHQADHLSPLYPERCTGVMALAVAMCSPPTLASDSYPMNSPAGRSAMVASFPSCETTVSFARPV